jgi:hypothetical protein
MDSDTANLFKNHFAIEEIQLMRLNRWGFSDKAYHCGLLIFPVRLLLEGSIPIEPRRSEPKVPLQSKHHSLGFGTWIHVS